MRGDIFYALCCFCAACGAGFSYTQERESNLSPFFNSEWMKDSQKYRQTRSIDSKLSGNEENAESKEPYLTLVEEMHNQTLQSGDRASFRCKVEGYPMQNLTYTWYKDNKKLVDDQKVEPRIRIRVKHWGSRLQIFDVYSSDSGMYRCEASNILRRVYTSAYLHVSFNSLPDVPDVTIDKEYLKGKCEIYQGFACKEFLDGDYVYLESFQIQTDMEVQITQSLQIISDTPDISVKCQQYAKAAFCYYVFPPCETKQGVPTNRAKAIRLCQEDCDLLKHDICRREFFNQNSNKFISGMANQADCSQLPPTATSHTKCTRIGLPSVVDRQHKCYNDTGESYKGTLSVTANGDTCKPWPSQMLLNFPQLSGGHNFCRNPGGSRDAPWCYIDEDTAVKEICQVPLCSYSQGNGPDLVMILIPAVSVPLLLGCFVLIFCFACKKKKDVKNTQHTKGIKMDTKILSTKRTKVPELSPNVIRNIGDLGDGNFGKVFKAQILSNLHYCPNDPVAVKTLSERANPSEVQSFQMEMETFSELQHPNVSCMKAVVVQPSLRCMIFEYTNGMDLHEYLVSHSPQADFAKPPSSASSHASSSVDHGDFVRMGIQVAAGMEYLTSHNFIHRDLATRNVLVCGNMDLKICNLGVVRDSYLSSYYRSPQGGQMLPIRWMAPESIQTWQFSDKSAVWSFGILLWEMFSYGLQPYCGYSNHEVLDMISRRQLLTCPDQCPAKMYSLMHECWSSQLQLRPLFKDIHAKLVGWEGTTTTRMTSHLAQGIHRQLNNVLRDGSNGRYVQNNGISEAAMNDRMNRFYPTQNVSGLHPVGPLPSGIPNEITTQRMYSGSAAVTSSGHSGNNLYQQPYSNDPGNQHLISSPHSGMNYAQAQNCPSYGSAPSRSSGSVASSEFTQHPPLRVNNLSTHHEVVEPPNSAITSPLLQDYSQQPERLLRPPITNGNPENESSPSQPPRMYVNIDNPDPDDEIIENPQNSRLSRSNSGLRPDERMSLSIYPERENSYDSKTNFPNRPKPSLAPKPPSYHKAIHCVPYYENDINQHLSNRLDNFQPQETESSRKAKSCDSGLPCEDMDSEGADSQRPLLPGKQGHFVNRPLHTNSLQTPSALTSISVSTNPTTATSISS